MLHNKPFKKITVTGQTINKEYVLAVHNPKDIDYSGVYALKLKSAGKLFRVDFSIAGDNEISHSDVNIGILNIVDNNSGIGTTQTAFNNNFTLKVVQNAAGLNLIIIRMLTVIMSGNFEMTISNSVPTGLDWSDYGKYIGKDYSTIPGYPFANETVKSPVKILGGINAPEVITTAATSVTSSGMILNANLTTLGSEASINVAFDWRLVGAGSWTRTSLVAKTTIGTFSATLSGLSSNTTYEYRAVVIGQSNPGNDAIGSVLSQLTVAINIDADSGVNITGTSGGSALNTTNIPSVTNGAVNNGTGLMTATADNCVSQTVEIAQQVGQSDFQLLKTTFALAPYQMTIDAATTSSSIVVTDQYSGKLSNGARFWLESSGVMKLVQAASVAETGFNSSTTFAITNLLVVSTYNDTTIAYGNNIFVIARDKGSAANVNSYSTSTDGATWVSRNLPISGSVWRILFCHDRFFIQTPSASAHYHSIDGINWTISTGMGAIWGICHDGSRFIAVDYNGIVYTSSNGTTWSTTGATIYVTTNYENNITPLIFANGAYYCVGSGRIQRSTDAITWTSTILSGSGSTPIGIAFGNGVYVIGTQGGGQYRSTNGTTWGPVVNSIGNGYSISFGNNLFMVTNGDTQVAISQDGLSWTTITTGLNQGRCLCFCNGAFYLLDTNYNKLGKSDASLLYKYTCTALTSLHGGTITTTPTLVYKAGQIFESSITGTSGTTSYVADTLHSVSRSGNILTLVFNQRAATGRYVRSKATVNKGDVISRYAIDLWN